MREEERDHLSERLGDGLRVRAGRRKEIEEMEVEAIEAEIKKMEETLEKKGRVAGPRGRGNGLGSLPLTLAILCLVGGGGASKCLYCL
jgi:hypothetical protein